MELREITIHEQRITYHLHLTAEVPTRIAVEAHHVLRQSVEPDVSARPVAGNGDRLGGE